MCKICIRVTLQNPAERLNSIPVPEQQPKKPPDRQEEDRVLSHSPARMLLLGQYSRNLEANPIYLGATSDIQGLPVSVTECKVC